MDEASPAAQENMSNVPVAITAWFPVGRQSHQSMIGSNFRQPMSNKPNIRQEQRRLQTRAALFDAGLKLFAERAVDSISIDDIVQQAGVAKGSFFNHFTDKAEFASAVAMKIRIEIEVNIAAVNRDVTDPALRIAHGVCSFVKFALLDRQAAKSFARARAKSTGLAHPLDAGLRTDVELGTKMGRFSLCNVATGEVCVIGVTQRLLTSILTNSATPLEARTLSIDVLTVLLTGFGVTSTEARRVSTIAACSLIE